jgi:hypothetical protein
MLTEKELSTMTVESIIAYIIDMAGYSNLVSINVE